MRYKILLVLLRKELFIERHFKNIRLVSKG